MSIEILRITTDGVGWSDISDATPSELMDIELGIMTNQVSMLCFKCHTPIPRGNVCVNHKDVKGAIYFD